MTAALIVRRAGPQLTVQDMGRPGYLARGLSRGGAADRLALAEGAALLGQKSDLAALEMAGFGGVFEATGPLRIALSGAPMAASIGARPVSWNASHALEKGDALTIGAARTGSYGYLSMGGGIDTPVFLGSRAAHLAVGIGGRLAEGDRLSGGPDADPGRTAMTLDPDARYSGGTVRIVPGAQTALYDPGTRARFETTEFTRDSRGNRQGVRLTFEGAPFEAQGQRTILSEGILPGDVQMTGDGTPFVLLPECQTTGGYPRIGSVLPEDLPIVAQAAPGARLRFRFLTLDAARAAHRDEAARWAEVRARVRPLYRDPHDIGDLLSYQLISGVTAGADPADAEEAPT